VTTTVSKTRTTAGTERNAALSALENTVINPDYYYAPLMVPNWSATGWISGSRSGLSRNATGPLNPAVTRHRAIARYSYSQQRKTLQPSSRQKTVADTVSRTIKRWVEITVPCGTDRLVCIRRWRGARLLKKDVTL
jgi:hypothetical protein